MNEIEEGIEMVRRELILSFEKDQPAHGSHSRNSLIEKMRIKIFDECIVLCDKCLAISKIGENK